ncbi:hypothetical protein H6775_00530 [Candidatus Nomurabacteria bacterium]|nr:hypothetical protein [Candidatus Nomurabacteria bacterium]
MGEIEKIPNNELENSILEKVLAELQLPENAGLDPDAMSVKAFGSLARHLIDINQYRELIDPLTEKLKSLGYIQPNITPRTSANSRDLDMADISPHNGPSAEELSREPSEEEIFEQPNLL